MKKGIIFFITLVISLHSFIFSDAHKITSKAHEYTINLMWINRSLQERQKYIFPAQDDNDLKETYLNPVILWAKCNPKSSVHVWFDSSLTTETACSNTLEKIKEFADQQHIHTPIVLQDIQDIPEVKNNKEVFSDTLPVYFRADLLRVIAAVHTLSTHTADHFVYADFDVKPLSEQELFDKKTVQRLEKFGIVMAKERCFGYENSFQITSKHNKNLIDALQKTIIDLNIKRAHNALKDAFFINTSGRIEKKNPMRPLQQIVYSSYPSMFKYFYHVQGLGTLEVHDLEERNGQWCTVKKVYDDKQHGLKPFGLTMLDTSSLSLDLF